MMFALGAFLVIMIIGVAQLNLWHHRARGAMTPADRLANDEHIQREIQAW